MASNELQPLPDPDDMFADTRMSFGDHIEDLRSHLMRAAIGFVVAMMVCIMPPIGPWALKFITAPVEQQLNEFFENREANRKDLPELELKKIPPIKTLMYVDREALRKAAAGKDVKDVKIAKVEPDVLENLPDAINKLLEALDVQPVFENPADDPKWAPIPVMIPDPQEMAKSINKYNAKARPKHLIVLTVTEAFFVYFKVGLLVGFVVSSPWVFYQVWSFVAAGLYQHEKRLVNYYLPISLGLFLTGFFVCEFLALPRAIEALLWFNEWLGFDPELRLSEWLGFAIMMPLVFGLSFQTPIVMMFLYKIGLASIDTLRAKRRMAYFVMAIFSAVITPSTDALSMLFLWVPMCLLYDVGIWLCKMQGASTQGDEEGERLDEMVGV